MKLTCIRYRCRYPNSNVICFRYVLKSKDGNLEAQQISPVSQTVLVGMSCHVGQSVFFLPGATLAPLLSRSASPACPQGPLHPAATPTPTLTPAHLPTVAGVYPQCLARLTWQRAPAPVDGPTSLASGTRRARVGTGQRPGRVTVRWKGRKGRKGRKGHLEADISVIPGAQLF